MRTVVDHVINPVNDRIKITVLDEPGAGGASHHYVAETEEIELADIRFQNGPINEAGLNGVTQEVLLAIVIDRLRSFQAGPFSCRENALALTHCQEALHWLHHRTLDRMRRGVEGQTKA
jgi:hypothetical protein